MSDKFNIKKYTSVFSFLFLFAVVFYSLPVDAATFLAPDSGKNSIVINEVQENLYVSGNEITIQAPIKKDLVVAGNKVSVNNKIERSLMVAGNEVTINSLLIGGSVRAAANTLDISGNFNEDLVIAANKVVIKNSRVRGDLIISANSITLENSFVSGKFYGSYSELKGDLQNQINGEIKVTQYQNQSSIKAVWFKFSIEISTIIGLAIVSFYLMRRNRLENMRPRWNMLLLQDLGIGFTVFIAPVVILIIGIFLQIYPLVLALWGLIWILFALSNIFVPIYISSFIKNTFKTEVKMIYLIPLVYISLLVLNVLPVFNMIVGLLNFIVLLITFGYLSRNSYRLFDNALKINKITHKK